MLEGRPFGHPTGAAGSACPALQGSPNLPSSRSRLSSGLQDSILSVLLGGLELSPTPPTGKCWKEEEGTARAFVLREREVSSARP